MDLTSDRMNHRACIDESHPVPASVRFHNRPGLIIGFVASPVALEFQKHLKPTRQMSACGFHSLQCELVPFRCQPPTCVRDDEDFEAVFEGG